MAEQPFGIAQGIQVANAIRGLQLDAERREAVQEEKDIFAAADLMNQRKKFEADPEKIRQIDTQISGYSPRARIKAAGQYAIYQRSNEEALKSEFQQEYMTAYRGFQSAQALAQQGREQDALNIIGALQTKHVKDGYRHEYVKGSNGFEHIIYRPNGEELQRSPVKLENELRNVGTILSNPGNAFEAYLTADTTRKMENLNEINNMKEFRDKSGNVFFMHRYTDRGTQEFREAWYDKDGNPIARPDQSTLLKSKSRLDEEDKTERQKNAGELLIEERRLNNKRLGILIRKAEEEDASSGGEENYEKMKPADRKRDQQTMEKMIEHGLVSELAEEGYEVDTKKGIVYKDVDPYSGKPIVDKKATSFYHSQKVERTREVREERTGSQTHTDAYDKLVEKRRQKATKEAREAEEEQFRKHRQQEMETETTTDWSKKSKSSRPSRPKVEEAPAEVSPAPGTISDEEWNAMTPEQKLEYERQLGSRNWENMKRGIVGFFKNGQKYSREPRTNEEYLRMRRERQ